LTAAFAIRHGKGVSMNKVFRLVWSRSLQALVVASELAPSRGKAGPARRALGMLVLTGAVLAPWSSALAQDADAAKCSFARPGQAVRLVDCASVPQLLAEAAGGADAVNAAQLEEGNRYFQATGNNADPAADVGAYAEGLNATASGDASNAIGDGASAYGSGAMAMGQYATASGYNATATADSATAVGGYLYVEDEDGNVILDQTTTASEVGASAFGAGAQANGAFSTATGSGSVADGLQAAAGGYGSTASGDLSAAYGGFSAASGYGATALGYGAEATIDFATSV